MVVVVVVVVVVVEGCGRGWYWGIRPHCLSPRNPSKNRLSQHRVGKIKLHSPYKDCIANLSSSGNSYSNPSFISEYQGYMSAPSTLEWESPSECPISCAATLNRLVPARKFQNYPATTIIPTFLQMQIPTIKVHKLLQRQTVAVVLNAQFPIIPVSTQNFVHLNLIKSRFFESAHADDRLIQHLVCQLSQL